MKNNTIVFSKIKIPKEIINSGDYSAAESILLKQKVSLKILAEFFYRLGRC